MNTTKEEKINALLKELEGVNAVRESIADENSPEMDFYDQWANDICAELSILRGQ